LSGRTAGYRGDIAEVDMANLDTLLLDKYMQRISPTAFGLWQMLRAVLDTTTLLLLLMLHMEGIALLLSLCRLHAV
jgi:hypothetical protein